jgi:hypothetical protein
MCSRRGIGNSQLGHSGFAAGEPKSETVSYIVTGGGHDLPSITFGPQTEILRVDSVVQLR